VTRDRLIDLLCTAGAAAILAAFFAQGCTRAQEPVVAPPPTLDVAAVIEDLKAVTLKGSGELVPAHPELGVVTINGSPQALDFDTLTLGSSDLALRLTDSASATLLSYPPPQEDPAYVDVWTRDGRQIRLDRETGEAVLIMPYRSVRLP
jgi:hypothetical protein